MAITAPGNIWGLIRPGAEDQQVKILFTTGAQITTFGLDEAGEIYLHRLWTGNTAAFGA